MKTEIFNVVHFYEHDVKIRRVWNWPRKYVKNLQRFQAIITPDFSDSKLFHKNVVASLIGRTPLKTTTTSHGIKHEYETKLIGKNGKSVCANETVVIQKDNGRITHKIVTMHPRKKDK